MGTWDTALSAIGAAQKVAEDPHLPEVICHVNRLSNIQKGQPAGPNCPGFPTYYQPTKGVGLRYVVGPLRTLVKAREHPAAAVAIVGGSIGLIFLAGYVIGKRRR